MAFRKFIRPTTSAFKSVGLGRSFSTTFAPLTDLSEEEQMMKEAGYFLRALTARD